MDLTLATLISLETLALNGTEVTLRADQLGAFTAINGTFGMDRVILSASGVADLTGATFTLIDEIRGSGGADKIVLTDVNTGLFIDGRGGNDTVQGTLQADLIKGSAGNDVLTGDEGNDTLIGGQGVDNIQGGLGNDVIRMGGVGDITGLAETINGGADADTLDFTSLGATGRVNLAGATIVGVETLLLSNNQVIATAAVLGGFQSIFGSFGFERIDLSAAGVVDLSSANISNIDEFRGTAGADTFLFAGGQGNSLVNTFAGADSVQGGDGNETLLGGDGNDTLGGGAGADVFAFGDRSEMGLGAARDVITDFVHGQDIIRLTGVDADLNTVGDQLFNYIAGAAFDGHAGQLRYSGGVLSGDVDGDTAADFAIVLTGTPVLAATDLQL